MRKDIPNKVIIENRTDLVGHPYCIVLDIKELYSSFGRHSRRTKVVNLYDNKTGEGYQWQGSISTVRQAIQDISWRQVIRGRVLIVGNMNAYSSILNPHCRQKANAGPLEELIESCKLMVNNDTGFPTHPSSPGISIIDLALTSPELGLLRV